MLCINLESCFLKFDASIGIFSKFLIFGLYAGLLRSLELRHQYMETQAFHDLIQEASLCNGSGTSHSTARLDNCVDNESLETLYWLK